MADIEEDEEETEESVGIPDYVGVNWTRESLKS